MPDLATELAHLQAANQHVEQAQAHIAEARARIAASTAQGRELGTSLTSLETLERALDAFEGHRSLIVRTIEDIKAGKI